MGKVTLVVTRPLVVSGKKVKPGFVLGHVVPVEGFEGRDIDKALQVVGLRVDEGDLNRESAARVAAKKNQKDPEDKAPTALDPEKMSADEIKKELAGRKIEFSAKAKHPELIELLKAALQPAA